MQLAGTVNTALSASEPQGSARALRSVQLIAHCDPIFIYTVLLFDRSSLI
jgi:hypothetical protein